VVDKIVKWNPDTDRLETAEGYAAKWDPSLNRFKAVISGAGRVVMWDPANDYFKASYSSESANLWKLSSGGVLQWRYYSNGHGQGVAVDDNGYTYQATTGGPIRVHKLQAVLPVKEWGYNSGYFGADVAADVGANANVYLAGSRVDNFSVWKLDSDGVLQWSYDTGADANGVAVDASGNVYIAGENTGSANVWKLNSDGVLQWTFDTRYATYGIAVDGSGNVYVVSRRYATAGGYGNVRKLNSSGVEQWVFNTGTDWALGVAVDASGNVYVAGADNGLATVWKLNSSGVEQWKYDTGANRTQGVCVDGSGNVYVAGQETGSASVWKLNSSGVLQWSYNTGDETYAIAVDDDGYVYVTGSPENYSV